MIVNSNNPEDYLQVGNFCVSFIDLLGQRKALEGHGLLPSFETEDQRNQLIADFRKSIGAIIKLQIQAEAMLKPLQNLPLNSPLRTALPPEQQAIWDEVHFNHIKTQRWSDGLVFFISLGDTDIKCRMEGIFSIFCLAGALCFLGLANRNPIRGAIEIAWGIELHPNELYGAAVARAYELESEIAQYPRIVIGAEAVKLLQAHHLNTEEDIYSQCDKALASLCLDMLIQDIDGHWLIHYLGDKFQMISHTLHTELYSAAKSFVHEQLMEHNSKKNTKLALRYSRLLQYFDTYPPIASEKNQSTISPDLPQ